MHRVLVYRRNYLHRSETFIYEQLIGHKRVKPIVLTRNPVNLDQFPYSPIYLLKSYKGFSRWLKQKEIKCLHARFGPAGLELLKIANTTGIPLITSFHGFDATKRVNKYPRYRWALKRLFRSGKAFTVVSEHMKKKLLELGCPAKKICTIHSGIDLEKFPPQPLPPVSQGAYRLLSVGRLTEKKGMDILIRSFIHVRKRYPETTLTIVGEGEEQRNLRRLIRVYKLQKYVMLKGALSHQEVQKELAECHLFVLACKTAKDGNQEGIPNVLMEAMATGRPVISTRHAGIPELIEHNQTGFLVPEKRPLQLAEMINRTLDSSASWPQLIAQAREKVEQQHDIRVQRVKLENLYLQVIRKTR